VEWKTVHVDNEGRFELEIEGDIASKEGFSFTTQGWFDRTDLLSSSVSNTWNLNAK